jgi:predicted HTH transcriptional regulator
MARVIREAFERLRRGEISAEPETVATRLTAQELIEAASGINGAENAESTSLEFKAAARWNQHSHARDAAVEFAIVKAVAGFMNAQGGTLLIGVNDSGQAVGLQHDLKTTQKGDLDGYQLWLTDLFGTHMTKAPLTNIAISFEQVEGQAVCRVDVAPATAPVYVNQPKGERTADFYVRLGNSTRKLATDEFSAYQRDHWG